MDYEKFLIGDRVQIMDIEMGFAGEHGNVVDVDGDSLRIKLDGGREIETTRQHCTRSEKSWIGGTRAA